MTEDEIYAGIMQAVKRYARMYAGFRHEELTEELQAEFEESEEVTEKFFREIAKKLVDTQ